MYTSDLQLTNFPEFDFAETLSRYPAVRACSRFARCLCRIHTRGHEYPAGFGVHQDCRHARGYRTLYVAVASFRIAAFGSSRYLVVSADSATAAIFAGGVASLAPPSSARYVALAGAVALLTAGFLLLARLLKLGFIADFLSQTVLVGFLTGVGFQVGIAVLGEMLGVSVSARRTVMQLAEVSRRLPEVHVPTLAVSGVALGVLFLLQRFAPRIPGALIAVVGAVTASAIWNFSGHGIAIIGPVAGGFPHVESPK